MFKCTWLIGIAVSGLSRRGWISSMYFCTLRLSQGEKRRKSEKPKPHRKYINHTTPSMAIPLVIGGLSSTTGESHRTNHSLTTTTINNEGERSSQNCHSFICLPGSLGTNQQQTEAGEVRIREDTTYNTANFIWYTNFSLTTQTNQSIE